MRNARLLVVSALFTACLLPPIADGGETGSHVPTPHDLSIEGAVFKACVVDGAGEQVLVNASISVRSEVIKDKQGRVHVLNTGTFTGTGKGQTSGADYNIAQQLQQIIEAGSGRRIFKAARELSHGEIPKQIVQALLESFVFSECGPRALALTCDEVLAGKLEVCDLLYRPGDGVIEDTTDWIDCKIRAHTARFDCHDE